MIDALNRLFQKGKLQEDASPAEIEQALEAKANEIQEAIDALTSEKEALASQIETLQSTVSDQTATIEQLNAQIEELKAESAEALQAALDQVAQIEAEKVEAIRAKEAAEKLAADEIAKAHAAPPAQGGSDSAAEFNEAFKNAQKQTFPRVASTTF